jgi:hypothetical protein
MTLLTLPGDPGFEGGYISLIFRDPRDTLLPESDIYSGTLLEWSGDFLVPFPAGKAQIEDRIVQIGLDLRRQHAGRCAPGRSLVSAALDDQDLPAGTRQFSGARGPYHAAADDYNF